MSPRETASETLPAHAVLQPRAARLVSLIGLTLGLCYLTVFGGTLLKVTF